MPRVTITIPGSTPQPYRFDLSSKEVKIGRATENDIVVPCGSVSSHHAIMARISGGFELRDSQSTNGTKLNGTRLTTIPLHSGMSVELGDVVFGFSLTDEEQHQLDQELATMSEPQPSAKDELPPLPEKSVAQPTKARRAATAAPSNNESHSGLISAVFIVLACLAFFVGMSIRHQKDTGKPLLPLQPAGKSAPVPQQPQP